MRNRDEMFKRLADPIESISPAEVQLALQAYRDLIAGSCDIQMEPGLTVHEASEKYFRFVGESPFRQNF